VQSVRAEERIREYIEKVQLRQMIVLPLLVLLIAFGIVGATYLTTGYPVHMGYEFVGGTVVSFASDKTPDEIMKEFEEYNPVSVKNYGQRKLIEFPPLTEEQLSSIRSKLSGYKDVEIRQTSPLFGKTLQVQAIKAVLIAFFGMAIVVFIIFRTFIPSVAVVLSAFSDIVISIALMNIFGIKLTLATVAALLMLIGYSVDSDILLTNRLLRRKGEFTDRLVGAMKTGLTMTLTSLFAAFMLFIVASYSYVVSPAYTRIDILADIAVVLIFGLSVDIMNTWMLNAGLLRWYLTKK
jgi:preprotein translocase subunit SecF